MSGPVALLGRLSPYATDRVVFNLGAFGAGQRGEAMALRVAVTDPSRADIVSLGALGCTVGMDEVDAALRDAFGPAFADRAPECGLGIGGRACSR